MERVTFSNISIEISDAATPKSQTFPIFMDIEKRHPDSPIGRIRDVIFRDIQIHSGSGVLIQGMPESPIEELTMQNLTSRVQHADDYSERRKAAGGRRTTSDDREFRYAQLPAYLTLAHVRGLMLDNVRVLIEEDAFNQYERSAICGHELENGILRSIHRQPAGIGGQLPVVSLHNCRHIMLTDCMVAPDTPALLGLSGKETADISLVGGFVGPVTRTEEVTAGVRCAGVK